MGWVWLFLGFWTALTTLALVLFPLSPRRTGVLGWADLALNVAGMGLALWGVWLAWQGRNRPTAGVLDSPGAGPVLAGLALTRLLGGSPLWTALALLMLGWLALRSGRGRG